MSTTTVARLRCVLAEYFEPAPIDTALRCARLAGQIPAGQSGHAGCRSAPVSLRSAILILLALASAAQPKDAPAAAERIGAFRLLRRDQTHSSEPPRRVAFENQQITLLDAMISEVERFDPPNRVPSCWDIAAHGACQVAPDRLVFGPSLAALDDPSDAVVRSCRIPGRLLGDVAGLFRIDRAEAA